DRQRTEVWIVPASGGKARKFTAGPDDSSPRWSPDGQWIAFLSNRPEPGAAPAPADAAPGGPRGQIYVISALGGEAEKLTDAKAGVSAFSGSPDSPRIAYAAGVPLTDDQEKKRKDKDDAQVV